VTLVYVRMRSPLKRAKGLKYRQEKEEAVAGFFSHIGELYNVHHLWGELDVWPALDVSPLPASSPSVSCGV
jgi:hypothetical protein